MASSEHASAAKESETESSAVVKVVRMPASLHHNYGAKRETNLMCNWPRAKRLDALGVFVAVHTHIGALDLSCPAPPLFELVGNAKSLEVRLVDGSQIERL